MLQNQKNGKLFVADVPSPQLQSGGVLVRNAVSVISSGTERTSVRTAQASLLGKARARPDLVRQVLDNVRREGIGATYEKVKNRLDNYKELGYSSAGVVIASSVPEFRAGDRVACGGVAFHAEEIFVPKHLAAKVPDGVDFETAAFTTLCAIALQGVRQADVRLGETVVVIGLGLLGLVTVQLLRSAGCRVVGLDVEEKNFSLAQAFGCQLTALSKSRSSRLVAAATAGAGADAVIITASSKSSQPIELAMSVARKRAKVVIVGAVGMTLQRSPFYEKELELRISCSYGPGRYDPAYEVEGHDYPIGYVRWTENRNMHAVLDLMAADKLDLKPLISHRFPITEALKAYDIVTGKQGEPHLAILLQYPEGDRKVGTLIPRREAAKVVTGPSNLHVGFIGAGNFAQSNLLPHLSKSDVALISVATQNPSHASKVSEQFGFLHATTDPSFVLDDPAIGTVFIATHHDSHAEFVCKALERRKNVFVEKPLAISDKQLRRIVDTYGSLSADVVVMTGFNRRFSRVWQDIKAWFDDVPEPKTLIYRVNAGTLPPGHWLYSPAQGGRVIGEVCHFIDCAVYLTGARPVRVFMDALERSNESQALAHGLETDFTITVSLSDGSLATILYIVNSDPAIDKEYCEISGGGKAAIMHNFRSTTFYQNRKKKTRRYDGMKGHREEIHHFIEVLKNQARPGLSFEEQVAVTQATFAALQSLQQRCAIDV